MRRKVAVALAVLAGLTFFGTAQAATGGPVEREIQSLFWAISAFAILVSIFVYGALFYFLIRYRRSRNPEPEPIEGNKRLEFVWTVFPTLILIVITLTSIPVLFYTDTRPPNPDTYVTVQGQQFTWTFFYEDGSSTIGELWIQEDVVVYLNVTSKDVIHSFAVPELGIKIDAVPGRVNHWWLIADRPGDYLNQCAEFCGVGHYGMRAVVHVFRAGTQPKIYGPPPAALQFTKLEMLPSDLVPDNLTFSIGSSVKLWIWNNDTTAHDFRIDAPTTTISPSNATSSIAPSTAAWLNFTINASSPAPIPYGPSDPAARSSGIVGNLTIQAGTVIQIFLDDALAGGGHSWSVSPNPLVIPKGANVTFEIHNIGSQPHNFTLQGQYSYVKYDSPIPAGATVFTQTFYFPEDSSDVYQCSIPGHAQSGMRAPYTVGAGGGPQHVAIPLFNMALITFAVGIPTTFVYVLHHARRPDE